MICEWRNKLDLYVDGELPESELAEVETHLRGCPSCAADALGRMQLKRSIHAVAKAFAPTNDFRKRIGTEGGALLASSDSVCDSDDGGSRPRDWNLGSARQPTRSSWRGCRSTCGHAG